MRIGFMGSPKYSVPTLQALVNAGFTIPVVYTQPPRPKGRGKKISPCPVHAVANGLNIPVLHPVNFKHPADITTLQKYELDMLVVVAYGSILPQAVLSTPKHGCINGHASILPRWRGAAPIHRAIESGDTITGVCVMQMDAGLDTGHVISTHTVNLSPTTKYAQLHDILAHLTAQAIVADIQNIQNWHPTPQSKHGICYAHKIQKSESLIHWHNTAPDIHNKVRAFHVFPTMQTYINGQGVKIHDTTISDIKHTQPTGTVLSIKPFVIACGDSTALAIQTVQKQGKKPLPIKNFLNGTPVKIGDIVGEI